MTLNEKSITMENQNNSDIRTPLKEVDMILTWLGNFYEEATFGTREEMMSEFAEFKKLPDTTSLQISKMLAEQEGHLLSGPGGGYNEHTGWHIQIMIVYLALSHCVDAMRPGLEIDQQWWNVCWAHNALGRLRGAISGTTSGARGAIADRAKLGAAARHKENRDMKNEAFAWLNLNRERFSSLDSAAEAIAGSVLPVKFRTAREWVGQWKKLQSAGTL